MDLEDLLDLAGDTLRHPRKKLVTGRDFEWPIRELPIKTILICILDRLSKKKILKEWTKYRATTAGQLCKTNPTTTRFSSTKSRAKSSVTATTPPNQVPVLRTLLPRKRRLKRTEMANGPTIFKLKAVPFPLHLLPMFTGNVASPRVALLFAILTRPTADPYRWTTMISGGSSIGNRRVSKSKLPNEPKK